MKGWDPSSPQDPRDLRVVLWLRSSVCGFRGRWPKSLPSPSGNRLPSAL